MIRIGELCSILYKTVTMLTSLELSHIYLHSIALTFFKTESTIFSFIFY